AGDYYGWSVSLSGDTLVVGAYGEASNQTTITNGTTSSADNSAGGSGAAYVYRRPQGTGTPSVSSLSPSSGAAAGDNIIIFGGNFYSGAVASVDGVNCTTTTVQGPNEIICTLPTKPTSGALTVTVTNSDTTTGSLAGAYTYP
ncbi:MAG: IPT/TIG domain-containing protein, partial [Deltaproteobacteria bacterium]|nr:IPT/TIG domain-containing protein [Deltaproteobacteria bacterium]